MNYKIKHTNVVTMLQTKKYENECLIIWWLGFKCLNNFEKKSKEMLSMLLARAKDRWCTYMRAKIVSFKTTTGMSNKGSIIVWRANNKTIKNILLNSWNKFFPLRAVTICVSLCQQQALFMCFQVETTD